METNNKPSEITDYLIEEVKQRLGLNSGRLAAEEHLTQVELRSMIRDIVEYARGTTDTDGYLIQTFIEEKLDSIYKAGITDTVNTLFNGDNGSGRDQTVVKLRSIIEENLNR